jgi:hypothetical protein
MFTQTIKTWLHKMFAWWPWKRSAQTGYTNVASPLNTGATQESVSRSTIDRVAPPAGITPRISTIEEWPERVVQSDLPAANEPGETLLSPPPVEIAEDSKTPADEAAAQTSPSPQQRLEFLQYLVKRGIINEGLEEK